MDVSEVGDFTYSCSRGEWNISQAISWILHKETGETHQLILKEKVLPDTYAPL